MNKEVLLCLLIVIFNIKISYTKDVKYKVSDIPKDLLVNAKTVVRNESIEFKLISRKSAKKKVQYALTILTKNGIENAKFIQRYDKFSTITNIKAKIYDAEGKLVKRLGGDDVKDYSAITGYTLYEDDRIKFIDPNYNKVPFTIEYSYDINYSGLLSYPHWMPYRDYNVSVEESHFTVIFPFNYNLRYLEKNLDITCDKTKPYENYIYTWHINNLPAIQKEEYSLPLQEFLPVVYLAPSDFKIGGYAGNLDSWNNFGKWIVKLIERRDNLNDNIKTQIQDLVKETTDERQKIKILYEYMQNKTRYVSVQIGIGGWKPIDAETVHNLSYGDCKALTIYMKSLLDVVGIKSYYTLIRAGKNSPGIIKEFPFNQFNHTILCVPLTNDTIWLECTNQNLPVGYLSTFTDDRDALLIKDTGGVIVHTPQYGKEDNLKKTKAFITLENTNAKADIYMTSSGMYYDDPMVKLMHEDDADKKDQIIDLINLPNFELTNYKITEQRSHLPHINLELLLEVNGYSTDINDRLFIPINPFNKVDNMPSSSKNRKSDIFIRRSYQIVDTIIYNLPVDYLIEQAPEKIELKMHFGSFNMNVTHSENQLIYIRRFSMNKGIYPAEDYDTFISFFQSIENSDNSKFILKKK